MTSGVDGYVFQQDNKGGLHFRGDFEGLYRNNPDPWEQSSGEDASHGSYMYYRQSRAGLVAALRRHLGGVAVRGLEIGCGHGHVVNCLADVKSDGTWHGMDISATAIVKARELYPQRTFFTGDITEGVSCSVKYDVVILGQLWWYVFHKLDAVIHNCARLLVPNGLLVLSQAFLKGEQLYGKEIADGFPGAVRVLLNYNITFGLVEARLNEDFAAAHKDGLIIMRKREK